MEKQSDYKPIALWDFDNDTLAPFEVEESITNENHPSSKIMISGK